MTIVGDVSGKGLIAAMRVSMILGVLRREESRQPDRILRGLNEALLSQGEMGFTTACCISMSRDGSYRLANAGHVSPYVEGEEIVAPPKPAAGTGGSTGVHRGRGASRGWQTHGVDVGRRGGGAVGEGRTLRLRPVACSYSNAAHDIADVAQRFGQDDDITVLTIARGM